MDVIFTIVSRNYAAQARTLMRSLARHEPTARRVVVATDGPIDGFDGLAEVIGADALGAPLAAMSVYYQALELNTAVKPFVFRSLLKTAPSVTYLDPDIEVFQPLAAVRESLSQAEICLTPHVGEVGSSCVAETVASGVYNLGFLAARQGPGVARLLDWWAERCRFDSRVDPAGGVFTDQKWMDFAPSFAEAVVLRSPALNLAYWNLEGRRLERGWRVDGEPLAFFHFSGFDPHRPRRLSKHQSRIRVAAGSPLAALLKDYAGKLIANGYDAARAIPYAHDRFADGRRVSGLMRRKALAAARAGETFDDGLSERVSAWMDAVEAPGMTRLMDQAWRDSAAAEHFDLASAESREGFRRWFVDNAAALGVDDRSVAAAEALAAPRIPEPWRDKPGTGPARDVAAWLKQAQDPPRACRALLAARGDLRARFRDRPDELLAWCLGPEAMAGRFAADLLPLALVGRLGAEEGVLVKAGRYGEVSAEAGRLRRKFAPAFGVASRAHWPDALTETLRAPHLSRADGLPRPFVRMFQEIWRSRRDLQQLYPLDRPLGRFRYLRWLLAGGLAEYGVEIAALSERVRLHPLMRLAERSLGDRRPAAAAPVPSTADKVLVVERGEARPDAAVFEGGRGRFVGAAPRRVKLVCFAGDPELAAADAIALHAQGVRWDRAVGAWDARAVAKLKPDSAALSFVDEIWTTKASKAALPRPVRTAADPVEAGLAS